MKIASPRLTIALTFPLAACLLSLCVAPRVAHSQEAPQEMTREQVEERIKELLATSKEQMDEGNYPAAIQSLSIVAKLTNNDAQVLLLRGDAQRRAKDLEGAMADLKEAISTIPVSMNLNQLQKDALLARAKDMRAKVYLEMGDVANALRDAKAAVKTDRSNFYFQLNLGKALTLGGDVLGGEKALTKYFTGLENAQLAAEEDPDKTAPTVEPEELAEAFRLRGQAYAAMQKYPKAMADIERSLEIDPEDHETYFIKGIVLLQEDKYAAASETLQQAIDNYEPADPDLPAPYAQAYLTRAAVLEEQGKKAEDPAEKQAAFEAERQACQELLDALPEGPQSAPTEAAAKFRLGVAERLLGNLPAAVEALSDAIDLNPAMGEAYFRRGVCFYYLDEPRLALGDFEQGAAINWDIPRSNLWKGRCWVSLGNLREAIKAFSEAVAVSDRYTIAYVHRGLSYLQIGEYERAVGDFNKAILLDPTDAKNYHYRGIAYSRLGEYERAIGSFTSAIKFDNKLLDAYDKIELELRKAGRGSLADEYRQRASEIRAEQSTAGN